MSVTESRVFGCILAGGRSSRMGEDKAFVELAGRTLAARAAERLSPQVARLAISSNADPALFAPLGLAVLADTVPGFQGPLAGILAGLEWAQAGEASALVTAAADTPFFARDLVTRLTAAARHAGTDIACASSGGRRHPVFALWPLRILPKVRCALDEGRRGVDAFLQGGPCAIAEFPAAPYDPFFNINRPEDTEAALAIIREHGE